MGKMSSDICLNYDEEKQAEACHGPKAGRTEGFTIPSEADLERLGTARPEVFTSWYAEWGFVLAICMSQVLTEFWVSGFNVVVDPVVTDLSIDESSKTWPASAFSLVVACFLLPFGKLADMYGGRIMHLGGLLWVTVWSIVAGVSRNELMLDFSRALQGLGAAAFLPSGLMLMGKVFRPGPRKNKFFSMYGAMAAVGFFAGIFCGGASAELLSWRWYFYIGAILSLMSFLIAFLSIPSMIDNYTASAPSSTSDMISCPSTREKRFDWQGILLIVSGLILVIYAITDFSHAPRGWRTPYISATFCSGLFLLAVAAWWELWRLPVLRLEIETRLGEERNCRLSKYRQGAACASGSVADQEADKLRRSRDHADPVTVDSWAILPVEFLRGKAGLQAVLAAMFFQYGALGVYLLYGAEYAQTIMGARPLRTVLYFLPLILGGIIIAIIGGQIFHRLSGIWFMLIAGIAWVLAPLLLVIMPPDASYWTYVFPSMLLATVGIDISFSLTNIYIMNCARESELGIAGAVISSNLHLAIALCLGLAEVVRSQTRKSLVKSGKKDGEVTLGVLRAVFVYEVVLAAVALVVIVLGVRMKKAGSELTEDERRRKLEGGGGGSEGSSREEFSVGAGMVVVRDEVCDEDASGLATATWRPESEDET